jgi:protein-tyrosine phosphatase
MLKTSQTDPILIAEVDLGPGRGAIGVTFAPGKNDGEIWARDLEKDLDAIAAWGANAVLTLLEPRELRKLAITRLGAEVARRGMEWLHMPIPDVGTPGPESEARWPEISGRLRARLDAGENILVHCRGGLGRAGMIAARFLVETGSDPAAAMRHVRAVRPCAIETEAQEEWVRAGPLAYRAGDGFGQHESPQTSTRAPFSRWEKGRG